MIELKERRTTRCDRYESDDGHFCNWIPIAAAAVGALGSYLAAGEANDASDRAIDRQIEANEDAGMPRWAPQSIPYVFGANGWQPPMPTMSQDAIDYGAMLAGGGNATGPMSMEGLLGNIGSTNLGGLLGYNQAAPPPLWAPQETAPAPAPAAPAPQAQEPPPWWQELMTNGGMGGMGQPLTIRESDWTRKQTMPWHNAALLPNMIGGME
jgi:hypothetical protein